MERDDRRSEPEDRAPSPALYRCHAPGLSANLATEVIAAARRAVLARRSRSFIAAISIALSVLTSLPAAAQSPTLERNVAIVGGRAPLRGTLLAPAGDAPFPVALMLSGSGPTDRNGNQPSAHTDNLKQLAYGLFAQGIATLRVDKRGIAASAPALTSEAEMKISDLVEDAKAWLRFLRRQDRFKHLFITGHSEGALIATLAAQEEQPSGLVSIAGIGSPLAATLRRQIASAAMPESAKTRALEILSSLERGELVPNIAPELNALFRPSVQPYLISSFKLDPSAELARTRFPVLVVQGTTDLQVSIDDAKKLAESREGVELLVIAGMNHTLKTAAAERAKQTASYIDPDIPLAPELVPAIARFIRQNEK